MKLEPFLAWCSAKGIRTTLELRIRRENDCPYRYTVFRDDYEPPPAEVLIRDDEDDGSASASRSVNLIQAPLDACLIAKSSEDLADRLLFERSLGESSEFAPYLDVLPTMQDFQKVLPRFWTPEQRGHVTDGGQLWRAQQIDQPRQEQFANSQDGSWALACVDSRSNFLPPDATLYSMTPLLDMINHDCNVETHLRVIDEDGDENRKLFLDIEYDDDTKRYIETSNWVDSLTKWTRKQQEKEVFISYGKLTNLELLMNYGFVADNNPCNTESLQIGVIGRSLVTIFVNADGSLQDDGVGRLRRNLATTEEQHEILSSLVEASSNSPQQWGQQMPFVSERNEVEVCALIAGSLEEALYEAKSGAVEAKAAEYPLVEKYLHERAKVLENGLQRIKDRYPEILG